MEIYRYLGDQEYGFTPSLYIDALLHHMAVHFDHLTMDQRKEYLYLALMEKITCMKMSLTNFLIRRTVLQT